jgi:hypothetical protein
MSISFLTIEKYLINSDLTLLISQVYGAAMTFKYPRLEKHTWTINMSHKSWSQIRHRRRDPPWGCRIHPLRHLIYNLRVALLTHTLANMRTPPCLSVSLHRNVLKTMCYNMLALLHLAMPLYATTTRPTPRTTITPMQVLSPTLDPKAFGVLL